MIEKGLTDCKTEMLRFVHLADACTVEINGDALNYCYVPNGRNDVIELYVEVEMCRLLDRSSQLLRCVEKVASFCFFEKFIASLEHQKLELPRFYVSWLPTGNTVGYCLIG